MWPPVLPMGDHHIIHSQHLRGSRPIWKKNMQYYKQTPTKNGVIGTYKMCDLGGDIKGYLIGMLLFAWKKEILFHFASIFLLLDLLQDSFASNFQLRFIILLCMFSHLRDGPLMIWGGPWAENSRWVFFPRQLAVELFFSSATSRWTFFFFSN